MIYDVVKVSEQIQRNIPKEFINTRRTNGRTEGRTEGAHVINNFPLYILKICGIRCLAICK